MKGILGVSIQKAAATCNEANSTGRAVVKRCHRELTEPYKERLQGEGLSVGLEPAH